MESRGPDQRVRELRAGHQFIMENSAHNRSFAVTMKTSTSFAETSIAAVRCWNAPCSIRHSTKPVGASISTVEALSTVESHIRRFADFERWKGKERCWRWRNRHRYHQFRAGRRMVTAVDLTSRSTGGGEPRSSAEDRIRFFRPTRKS